jgi:uncharacterized membrane protein YdjX (TVP38/TMEM64 family)
MALTRAGFIKGILVIGLASILLLSEFYWNVSALISQDKIRSLLTAAGPWAPVLFVLVMAAAVVISPIPSLPLDITGGVFFGVFWGTIYASVGALIGAVISFSIARFLGRELIERLLHGHINFCRNCSDKLLTKIVFLSRLIPFISFDIVSYGAGLTKMSLRRFSIATFLGMLPLTFIYNYFGATLILEGKISFAIGIMLVILFFLVPRWIEKQNLFGLREKFEHDQDKE